MRELDRLITIIEVMEVELARLRARAARGGAEMNETKNPSAPDDPKVGNAILRDAFEGKKILRICLDPLPDGGLHLELTAENGKKLVVKRPTAVQLRSPEHVG